MKTYQITLAGYDGATDATDHLVKWVNAPDENTLLTFIAGQGWTLACEVEVPFGDVTLSEADGVDFVVNAQN